MRPKSVIPIAAVIVVLLQFASWTQTTQLDPSSYYVFSLEATTVRVSSLIQTARGSAFSVAIYTGSAYDVYREGMSVEMPLDDLLGDPKSLVVDGARFRLHVADGSYSYTVRPGESGYDLVVSPVERVSMADALKSVLTSLHELGIVGTDLSMSLRSFDRSSIKGPLPPRGAAIDSVLYDLMIAEDWFAKAAVHGIKIAGLRVEVVAEKVLGARIPERFAVYVVSETEVAAKLLMPIEHLVVLAQSEGIGYVRLPYQPTLP